MTKRPENHLILPERRKLFQVGAAMVAGIALPASAQEKQKKPKKPKEITINIHDKDTYILAPQAPYGYLCEVSGEVSDVEEATLMGIYLRNAQTTLTHTQIIQGSTAYIPESEVDADGKWRYPYDSSQEGVGEVELGNPTNYCYALAEYFTNQATYIHYSASSGSYEPNYVENCPAYLKEKQKKSRKTEPPFFANNCVRAIPVDYKNGKHIYKHLAVSQVGLGNQLFVFGGGVPVELRARRLKVWVKNVAWSHQHDQARLITNPSGNNRRAVNTGCENKLLRCSFHTPPWRFTGPASYKEFGIFLFQPPGGDGVHRVYPLNNKVNEISDLDPNQPIYVQVNDQTHRYYNNSGGFDLDVKVVELM